MHKKSTTLLHIFVLVYCTRVYGNAASNTCANKNACSQRCIPNPDVTKPGTCYCYEDYEMSKSNKDECEDVQKCEQFVTCSQLCTNLNGTFQCSCIDGFQLSEDNNTSCELIEDNAMLIFTTESTIRINSLAKGSNISYQLVENEGTPSAFTFDARNGMFIYWESNRQNWSEIWRSRLNGSDKEIVVSTGLSTVYNIAYDWIGGNLYLSDDKKHRIAVCSIGQDLCEVVIEENHSKILGDLALHPNLGLMFWAVFQDDGDRGIMRAWMDGSFPSKIITDLFHIRGMTVDQGTSRLYWIDYHPDHEKSFWNNYNLNSAKATNKLDPTIRSTSIVKEITFNSGLKSIQTLNGFTLLHKSNQPILRKNHCADAGCSHVCTLTPNHSVRCLCPPGMELVFSKNCIDIPSSPKLLIGYGNILKTTRLNAIGKVVVDEFSLPDERYDISAISYNWKNATVIFSDILKKKIFEFDLKSKKVSVLVDQDVEDVSGLDFNGIGDNLYWVDRIKRTVEVMSFATRARVVLSREIFHPVDILLVPEEGNFFVATIDLQGGMILMFSMDGHNREVRYRNSKIQPNSLAFSHALMSIYWVDTTSNSIQYISVKDKNTLAASTLLIVKENPVSITIYKNEIFWTDRLNNQILYRCDYTADNMTGEYGRPIYFDSQLKSHISKNLKSFLTKVTVINQFIDFEKLSSHPCEKNNPCSHICLMGKVNLTAICYCPDGLHLDKHGRTCVPIQGYLNKTKSYSEETDNKPEIEKSSRHILSGGIEIIFLAIGLVILIISIVIIFRRKFLKDRVNNRQIRLGQTQPFTANFGAYFTSGIDDDNN